MKQRMILILCRSFSIPYRRILFPINIARDVSRAHGANHPVAIFVYEVFGALRPAKSGSQSSFSDRNGFNVMLLVLLSVRQCHSYTYRVCNRSVRKVAPSDARAHASRELCHNRPHDSSRLQIFTCLVSETKTSGSS